MMNDYLIGFSIGANIVLLYMFCKCFAAYKYGVKAYQKLFNYCKETTKQCEELEMNYDRLYDDYQYKSKAYHKLQDDYKELLKRNENK